MFCKAQCNAVEGIRAKSKDLADSGMTRLISHARDWYMPDSGNNTASHSDCVKHRCCKEPGIVVSNDVIDFIPVSLPHVTRNEGQAWKIRR